MKTRTLILATILICSYIICKETLSSKNKKIDIVGEAFNTDNKPVVAVSYGVAGNGGYVERAGVNYMKPEMVIKISDQIRPPTQGPLEAIDEIPSVTDYYDGGMKLNKVDVKCKLYANPTDCVHQSSCGWCGSTNSCIFGNNAGPLEPCVKGGYIFSPPMPNWQPQTNVINENVGGVKLTVISK